jgi:hypothetical protein
LAGSGTAGTPSDLDAVLEGIFGQAGTDSSGVSVSYALSNGMPSMTFWNFRDPAGDNISNQCLWGGVIETAEFAFGDEAEATVRISGPGAGLIEKPIFSSYTTESKGGLTAFPAEPSSLTYLGVPVVAFVGSLTINGVSTFKLSTGSIRVTLSRQLRAGFGSFHPAVPAAGKRTIVADFSLFEEDTAALAALKALAYTQGSFDGSVVLGSDAGNIWTFALNNMQIGEITEEDGGLERIVRLADCRTTKSSISANDELSLVCT